MPTNYSFTDPDYTMYSTPEGVAQEGEPANPDVGVFSDGADLNDDAAIDEMVAAGVEIP